MDIPVAIHITAGSLALASGYVALYASKGAPLHRKAGMVFVSVMLVMTLSGVVMALARGAAPGINVPAGLISAYLVVTAFTTVRTVPRWFHVGVMIVAFVVGVVSLTFGFEALALGGERKGYPAFPFFLFGLTGVLGSFGDLRMIRSGGVQGIARITRHLWRMSLALLFAAMSFFLGQSDEIPKALRHPVLLALPIVAVFLTLLYWLWRVRIRQKFRGHLRHSASEAV